MTYPDRCNNPKWVKFEDMSCYDGGYVKRFFVVNFGDGQTANFTSTQFPHPWKVPVFEHTYANLQTYTVTIKAYLSQSAYLSNSPDYSEEAMTVTVSGACPLIEYANSDWAYNYFNPNIACGGKIVASKHQNMLFGFFKSELYAATKMVMKNSKGNWVGIKTKLYVSFACDAKESDCTTYQNIFKSQDHNNSSYEEVTKRGSDQLDQYYWSTARSTHKYNTNNTTFYQNIAACN